LTGLKTPPLRSSAASQGGKSPSRTDGGTSRPQLLGDAPVKEERPGANATTTVENAGKSLLDRLGPTPSSLPVRRAPSPVDNPSSLPTVPTPDIEPSPSERDSKISVGSSTPQLDRPRPSANSVREPRERISLPDSYRPPPSPEQRAAERTPNREDSYRPAAASQRINERQSVTDRERGNGYRPASGWYAPDVRADDRERERSARADDRPRLDERPRDVAARPDRWRISEQSKDADRRERPVEGLPRPTPVPPREAERHFRTTDERDRVTEQQRDRRPDDRVRERERERDVDIRSRPLEEDDRQRRRTPPPPSLATGGQSRDQRGDFSRQSDRAMDSNSTYSPPLPLARCGQTLSDEQNRLLRRA
jgi:hypothetical protein